MATSPRPLKLVGKLLEGKKERKDIFFSYHFCDPTHHRLDDAHPISVRIPFSFVFFLVILFRFPCGIDWPAFQITRYWRLVRHLLVLKKSQFFIIVIQ